LQDRFENVPKVLEIILLPLYPVLMVMEIAILWTSCKWRYGM